MSQYRRTHQLIKFDSDKFILNEKQLQFSEKTIEMTFTEAVGATAIKSDVHFSRVGDIVTICFPENVYNGNQAEGLIKTEQFSIPEMFRPDHSLLIHAVMVINGSAGGATATQATQLGSMMITSQGAIQIGTTVNNAGELREFGGAAVSGSGNGLVKGVYSYHTRRLSDQTG